MDSVNNTNRMQHEHAIIIGAGPCGLATAIALQDIGMSPLVIEKEMIVRSIYNYPTNLQFFSTPELLEIGGIPFSTPNEKPTRSEALHYYRNVAARRGVRIHAYEEVLSIEPIAHNKTDAADGAFYVHTRRANGERRMYTCAKAVIATGYFDHPNMLGIPGEHLPKVSHFFREAHPYAGMNVAIIGGNNSAIDAALELVRVDAHVTVVYRKESYSPNIKPWVLPAFRSLVDKGRIRMLFQSTVTEIDARSITVTDSNGTAQRLDNDFVLAMTGFRPDRRFLQAAGIEVDQETSKPLVNPETMETNVPGLYIAGVIASGSDANEVFIETGRNHGKLIAAHVLAGR